MSHSKKKTPIFTYIGYSNKLSKRWCNRRFRKYSRMAAVKDTLYPVRLDEIMTEWEFHGDGKFYWKNAPEKYTRK